MEVLEEHEETSDVENEIMVVLSIYEDQLIILRDNSDEIKNVQITLYPATADNQQSQFVKILLNIFIPEMYPSVPLEIKFNLSRGLSDEFLQYLKLDLDRLMSDLIGESMLFEVIEFTKEKLTANNIPSCPCPICLLAFRELDEFLKTDCFHYFHCYCLNQYVTHCLQNQDQGQSSNKTDKKQNKNLILCPVCRVQLYLNFAELKNSIKPLLHEERVNVDLSHWNKSKTMRNEIFLHQKNRGGIIDLNAEKNKHLISEIEQAYLGSILPSANVRRNSDNATNSDVTTTLISSERSGNHHHEVVNKSSAAESKHRRQRGGNYQNYRGRGYRRVNPNPKHGLSPDGKTNNLKFNNSGDKSHFSAKFDSLHLSEQQPTLKNDFYKRNRRNSPKTSSGITEIKNKTFDEVQSELMKKNQTQSTRNQNNSRRDNSNIVKQSKTRPSNFHRAQNNDSCNRKSPNK